MSLHRPPPDRAGIAPAADAGLPTGHPPRQAAVPAQALLAAAVTVAGFSVGYFQAELAVAIDQLIVFCGVGLP